MPSDTEILTLPVGQSVDSKREARLLVQEAKDTVGEPLTKRAESKQYIKNYTADRLFREHLRRYKLIRSMLAEQMSIRAIVRAAHCDPRTIKAVERRESASIPTLKKVIAGRTARVASMSIERLEEEVESMPLNLLAMTFGICVDKLNILTGDPNQRIEVNINDNRGNIFDRIQHLASDLAKVVQAREVQPLELENTKRAMTQVKCP